MKTATHALSLVALLAAAACGTRNPGTGDSGTSGTGDSGDGALDAQGGLDAASSHDGGDGGSASDAGDGAVTRAQFCSGDGGTGAPGGGGADCTGRTAATTFRYALCTCDGLVASQPLTTDSFDSTMGPYSPPGGHGGSVGTNGTLNATADVQVGGSLLVGGDGITVSGGISVAGELRCNGRFVSDNQPASVGAGAWINGDVQAQDLTIHPALTLPAGANVNVSGTEDVPTTTRAPVTVPPPCDCSAPYLVDVAGIVAVHAGSANDDDATTLVPGTLTNVSTATTITLPCGRYYVDRVTTSAPLTLVAQGRTALYVAGDIALGADFTVQLAPGATIDVFVTGNLVAAGNVALGSAASPASARMYLGGSGTIDLSHASVFAGNLYAPAAELVLASNTVIYGGVFVRRVSAAGSLAIHYDTAVLRAGDMCPAPSTPSDGGATGCGSCRDCDNQACVAGVCGSCTSDSQCCAPLVCNGGRCEPIPG